MPVSVAAAARIIEKGGGVRFSDGPGTGRSQTVPGHFVGVLQSDGYAAYDHVGGPRIVHAACWAHARRKFFQAVELNPQDQTASGIVAQMDELFAIDAQVREQTPTRSSASAAGKMQAAAGGDQVPNPGSTHGRTAKKQPG